MVCGRHRRLAARAAGADCEPAPRSRDLQDESDRLWAGGHGARGRDALDAGSRHHELRAGRVVGRQPPDPRPRAANPLKLLHVVASYLPASRYGGTIVSVHGLCRALAARGHDVHVFTTSVDGPGDSPVPHGEPVDVEGVKVWYFQSNSLRRLYYAPALADALRQSVSEFAIVHTHAIYLWPLWTAAREARRAGVPY